MFTSSSSVIFHMLCVSVLRKRLEPSCKVIFHTQLLPREIRLHNLIPEKFFMKDFNNLCGRPIKNINKSKDK